MVVSLLVLFISSLLFLGSGVVFGDHSRFIDNNYELIVSLGSGFVFLLTTWIITTILIINLVKLINQDYKLF